MHERPGRRVGQDLALREDLRLGRRGVAPVRLRVEDQVVENERRDVVEHQRGDDLVGREERPQHAPGSARAPRRRRAPATIIAAIETRRRRAREQRARCPRRRDRADVELALAADVEEVHPERDRGAEAGEERAASPTRASRRAPPSATKAASTDCRNVCAGECPVASSTTLITPNATTSEPSGTTTVSQRGCRSRRSIRIEQRRYRSAAGHQQADLLDGRGRGVDLAHDPPSYMTTMRSASARISSRSSLISRTATPLGRGRRAGSACTVSIAATSSPRVGEAATSTLRVARELARRARPSAGCRPRAGAPAAAGSAPRDVVALDQLDGARRGSAAGGGAGPASRRAVAVRLEHDVRGDAEARRDARVQPVLGHVGDAGADRLARVAAAQRACPSTATRPRVGGRMPVTASASSRWPLPATPATPTISPARTASETPRSASPPRSPRAQSPSSLERSRRRARARARAGAPISTSRPTISAASDARRRARRPAPSRPSCPPRSTVTRSETAITSCSLCEMKIDRPALVGHRAQRREQRVAPPAA